MNRLALIGALLLLAACGKEQKITEVVQAPAPAAPAPSCTITDLGADQKITCGTQSVIVPTIETQAVQFCPSYSPAYPSTFPESGICVGGRVYGLYYDPAGKGVFLSLLPPGSYTSTSNDAPCNFTVGDRCQITQQ